MDKDIFYISVFMLIISISAQILWLYFAKIPCPTPGEMPQFLGIVSCSPSATAASLQEIQNIAGYIMLFGFILLPIGLFKDGLPIPNSGSKVIIGILLVLILGVSLTYVLTIPVSAPSAPPQTCGAPPQGETFYICIQSGASTHQSNFQWYSPDNVTLIIGKNSTVQWTNDDNTVHTVTSQSGDPGTPFNSGDLSPGATFTWDFTVPGTYYYYCAIHTFMKGTIIVKSS